MTNANEIQKLKRPITIINISLNSGNISFEDGRAEANPADIAYNQAIDDCLEILSLEKSPIVGGDVKEVEPNLSRIWKLIKQTAVQDYDPASKLSGLLFKNHKTGDFAFVSHGDVKIIERALTAPALDAGKVQEGYKLMPIEPTMKQLCRMVDVYADPKSQPAPMNAVYRALVTASPATSDDDTPKPPTMQGE